MRLRFNEFVLDTSERVLLRDQVTLAVEPKVFDCIALLARESGRLVSVERLRAALWPDVHVGDGALRRVINEARKALGDRGDAQAIIQTRKRLGYVFLPAVESSADAAERFAPWPFVGRTGELALLETWLGRGALGGMCLVSGEAGAGKSCLLAQLSTRTPPAFRWLLGHCRDTPGLPPFWPFREMATQIMGDPLLRARALSLVARTPAVLQLVPELAGDEPPLAQAARTLSPFALCESLAALLGALSQVCPIALVLEDVHWSDHGSLALLESVARVARTCPLFVCATYRHEAVLPGGPLSQLVGRSSGRGDVFSVHLEPLGLDELSRLLAEVRLPGSPARSAPALLRVTGGNALYVHELVRHLLATGSSLETTLPPSLHHIVAERLRGLPDATQQRLGQAAILGADFDLSTLAAVVGSARDTLERELMPARKSGLLRRSPVRSAQLQFSHALVREALLQLLAPASRRGYHRAAWHALSARGASSGELAVHAFEADELLDLGARRSACEHAGREAFAAQLFDRAALHLGRAVALGGDAHTRADAELALCWSQARWQADDPEREVQQAFLDAADRARRAAAPDLLAEAALGYALGDESSLSLRMAALRPHALELMNEAWERLRRELEAGVDSWPRQIAYRLAAALCWLQAEAEDATYNQRTAARALRLAPEQLSPTQTLWLLALRALAEPERAAELAQEIVQRSRDDAHDPRRCIEVLTMMMALSLELGMLDNYRRAADEIARLVALLPQPALHGRAGQRMSIYVSLPLCVPVTLAVIRGELALAERTFWQLAEHTKRLGFTPSRESEHDGFHILLQLQGYLGRASALQPLVEAQLATHPEGRWFATLLKAQFSLERGDRESATQQFAQLRESGLVPRLGERVLRPRPETLLRLADVCVEVGTCVDADYLYRALRTRADRVLHDGTLICWGSGARPLGALALKLGRHRDAERHLTAALAMNQRLGHRPELLRTQLDRVRLLLATGRTDEARALFAAQQREASTLGMPIPPSLTRALPSG